MATDEPDSDVGDGVESSGGESEDRPDRGVSDGLDRTRGRLEEGAERAVDEFDQGIVDLLSWLLDTETRARIYVHLRKHPDATSQEIADGTGLYPSTVREALSDLHGEGTVTREKRENAGAGNNPYEYRAIPPSQLVQQAVGDIQSELNAVFNLDERLGTGEESRIEPVTITVEGDAGDDAADDTALDVRTQGPDSTEGDDEGREDEPSA